MASKSMEERAMGEDPEAPFMPKAGGGAVWGAPAGDGGIATPVTT